MTQFDRALREAKESSLSKDVFDVLKALTIVFPRAACLLTPGLIHPVRLRVTEQMGLIQRHGSRPNLSYSLTDYGRWRLEADIAVTGGDGAVRFNTAIDALILSDEDFEASKAEGWKKLFETYYSPVAPKGVEQYRCIRCRLTLSTCQQPPWCSRGPCPMELIDANDDPIGETGFNADGLCKPNTLSPIIIDAPVALSVRTSQALTRAEMIAVYDAMKSEDILANVEPGDHGNAILEAYGRRVIAAAVEKMQAGAPA